MSPISLGSHAYPPNLGKCRTDVEPQAKRRIRASAAERRSQRRTRERPNPGAPNPALGRPPPSAAERRTRNPRGTPDRAAPNPGIGSRARAQGKALGAPNPGKALGARRTPRAPNPGKALGAPGSSGRRLSGREAWERLSERRRREGSREGFRGGRLLGEGSCEAPGLPRIASVAFESVSLAVRLGNRSAGFGPGLTGGLGPGNLTVWVSVRKDLGHGFRD